MSVRLVIRAKNNTLCEYREKHKLTQAQLAVICDVPVATIQYAETLRPITVNKMEKISLSINIPLEELFPEYLDLIRETINKPTQYMILNEEHARQIGSDYGGNKKLLIESLDADIDRAMELACKNPRQADILKMYFGIGYDQSYTNDEIGDKYGLTKARIMQIKEDGLRRLRRSKQGEYLREYFNNL